MYMHIVVNPVVVDIPIYGLWGHHCQVCRRCSNYIFILDWTPGFNGLVKDNCKTRREIFKFWDLLWLILEVWPYFIMNVTLGELWKHFPRYWPFVRGIHRSPVNSPHKGQWRGALMFSLICARINGWVNNGEAGDLRRHRAHYDVGVMVYCVPLVMTLLTGTPHIYLGVVASTNISWTKIAKTS